MVMDEKEEGKAAPPIDDFSSNESSENSNENVVTAINWEDGKELLKKILENLGFKQTKRETLFVKDLENDDALFCDFSKNEKGHLWTKKGRDVQDMNEYVAFRALQEGRAKMDAESNTVIITDGEREFAISIDTKSEKGRTDEGGYVIEHDKRKIILNPDFLINIKGKLYPTIDAVVDAMHKAGLLKDWKVEILKYPEKILPEKREGDKEIEDINSAKYLAVAKATITLIDGKTFEGIGDAHPLSIRGTMRPHVIRMAETRAVARTLRFAGNLHGVMAEELKEAVNMEVQ